MHVEDFFKEKLCFCGKYCGFLLMFSGDKGDHVDVWMIKFTTDVTSVQYCGGCSVHWRLFSTSGDTISTVGGSFSTVEVVQYCGG